jgi:asparagine synthase (glutamine-hydrolysing)
MCGIAGIVATGAPDYQPALERMVHTLRHRGPDGSGIFVFRGAALGHTRLSIIDPEGGQQPMLSPDSRLGLTFNGEIYGFQQIRDGLKDYPFTTRSDTEVVLALYQRHGPRLLAQLPGMFALALWDEPRQRLFCARDRFGEKPFYYAIGPKGEFLFASEIKGLIASGLVEPVLNRSALASYLQRLYVLPDETIYANIHTLPPAHTLVFERGNVTVERYWSPLLGRESVDLGDAIDEFRTRFEQAVARQLVADAPLGVFLSGGLDSSTIVAVASQRVGRLQTLSFRFDGYLDERPFARSVARRFGAEHIETTCKDQDPAELLIAMQSLYDEPFADSSNIPMTLLCREAKRHVKVALTGDGADELLGGYESAYIPLLMMQSARALPAWRLLMLRALRKAVATLRLRALLAAWDQKAEGAVLRDRYGSLSEAHRARRSYFADGDLRTLGLEPRATVADGATIGDAMRADIEAYLSGDILVKSDRASMAHGLELRSPFLDVEFATFCLTLPDRLKLDGRRGKLILRWAFEKQWPAIVRDRRKQGFGAPVAQWLRAPSVRDLIRRSLHDPGRKLFEVLPYPVVQRLASGSAARTWAFLVLALWMEWHSFRIPPKDESTCPHSNHPPRRWSRPVAVASVKA